VRVHAAGRQVIDDVEGDQVLLELSLADGALAERAGLVDGRPVLDAEVAEGVAAWEQSYPQTVLTGSSKTSWQILHLRWRLIFSGSMNSRLAL
jgi:hypothetical protein